MVRGPAVRVQFIAKNFKKCSHTYINVVHQKNQSRGDFILFLTFDLSKDPKSGPPRKKNNFNVNVTSSSCDDNVLICLALLFLNMSERKALNTAFLFITRRSECFAGVCHAGGPPEGGAVVQSNVLVLVA